MPSPFPGEKVLARKIHLVEIGLLLLAPAFTGARADDAVDWQGKKHSGTLDHEAGVWSFRTADGKALAIKQIAYVRFARAATPLPQAPVTSTLHLPGQQRISGMLRDVDTKQVKFIPFWGKKVSLERKHVAGIEQARVVVHDDFDQSWQAWQITGKPTLDREQFFHGTASLLLDGPKQRATRSWKPPLTDGDVRVYFRDSADTRFTMEVIAESAMEPIATLVHAADGYACATQRERFGVLGRSAGWHQLQVELRAGRLRVYIDDSCLGEFKSKSIAGIRILNDAGKLWIDELTVISRLPELVLPTPLKDYDTLWLTQGEQLFGHITHANPQTTTFDSKLGKRTLPWTQLRGIFFAQPQPPTAPNDPEISFRPGPGFPVDHLHAKLLRWENGKLIVQHELLGVIALDRARLAEIRWLAK